MLERNGDRIALLGAEDSNGYADQKTVQELADQVRQEQGAVYEILLSHRNNHYEQYTQARVDLTLAGHAHGGLIRLPGTDGLVGPKREPFSPVYCGTVRPVLWTDGGLPGAGESVPLLSAAEPARRAPGGVGLTEETREKEDTEHEHQAIFPGPRVGVPISLGYLAVSFTLGITAKNAGLSAFQATLTSLLVNASAGQYAAFTMMAAQGGYWEIAILEAVTNARYILMSCALSQKLPAASKLWHRLVIGFNVNDEIFGMAIAEQGKLNPLLFRHDDRCHARLGPGTFLGTSVGNVLPANVVSALSVGLYGMFLAVIIPPSRKSKVILGVVVVSMAASFALECIPCFASLASGTRIICSLW